MKRILFIFSFMLIGSTALFGQKSDRAMPPKEIAQIQTNKMSQNYSLNEVQKEKVYNLNFSNATKIVELKAQKKLSKSEYNSKLEIITNKHRSDISAVLDSNQKQKFATDNSKYDSKKKSSN